MKNFLVSIIILLLGVGVVNAASSDSSRAVTTSELQTLVVETDPGYVSLTETISDAEIVIDLTEFKKEEVDIVDAKITFKQNDTNADDAILNLIDSTDHIVKAVSASDSGDKTFTGLKNIVKDSEDILTLKINVENIDPDNPVFLTNISIQIRYYSLDTTPPEIKDLKVEETTQTSVLLSWETDEESISKVKYGKTSNYTNIAETEIQEDEDSEYQLKHSVLILNLLPGTTYHFQVIAEDAAGNLKEGKNQTILTPLTSRESSVLGADISLSSTISNLTGKLLFNDKFQIELKWSAEEAGEFDGFLLYRQIGNSTMQQIARLNTFETTFLDKELIEDNTYKYLVRTFKGANISPQSNVFEVETTVENIDSKNFFISTDVQKLIIFVGSATLGVLIIAYFVFTKSKDFYIKVTTNGVGKNKLKDPGFIENDFERRFKDS